MSRQRKRATPWIILGIIIIGILIGGIYYFLKKPQPPPPVSTTVHEPPPPTVMKEGSPQTKPEDQVMAKEEIQQEKKYTCQEIEAQVKEFFVVLDKQDYIRDILPEMDTYQTFARIVQKLSKSPPSPAGEGLNPRIMTKNIFYFFRVLNDTELDLVQAIILHEEETLEMNLVIFHQWLQLGPQCPDPPEIKPSFSVAYSLAGFLMNTIGGRAYLFRRSPFIREIVSYYALLIIYEADKRGENKYGIDILPEIRSLRKEMETNPDLLLRQTYLEQLDDMLVYYQMRR
jgi:hypothetical protein